MTIQQIELTHFRNYDQLSLSPHPGINIFFGANGSGKTNLLEAVHYCSLGKSHRINQDTNAVMMGEKEASCRLRILNRYSSNEIEIRLRPGEDSVKTVMVDGKKVNRLSEMMGVLRCVIFSPEDLNLIREGPAVRRKFLDMMISQLSRPYFTALQQYRIAISQRNAILRQAKLNFSRPDPMIQDFEDAMCQHAKLIIQERTRFSSLLSEQSHQLYQKISGRDTENFQVQYRPSFSFEEHDIEEMRTALAASREDDMRQGSASVGPHRDDLLLSLNQKSMKLYASQGQMRTGALSLKLSQLDIFHRQTSDYPVLLLDDVMSELDLNRRMNLLGIMEGIQTFITCSDEGDLSAYHNNRTYQVSSPAGKACLQMIKTGTIQMSEPMSEPVFD